MSSNLVDEVIEQPGPRVRALCPSSRSLQPLERLPPERVQAQVELEQDVLLALEVVVERGLVVPELLGDVAQRGLLVALLGEQLERDVEDALARRGAGRRLGHAVWAPWPAFRLG